MEQRDVSPCTPLLLSYQPCNRAFAEPCTIETKTTLVCAMKLGLRIGLDFAEPGVTFT